ncbi:hypothetical protein ACFS7Z_14785 [Pontibacter toksunensis]|uniref:Response regulatory domain-containing protein n=1 Tax=Pontibacter toksunensis TaxID=1332631 RepID=A0ABW6BUZ0_9BACT
MLTSCHGREALDIVREVCQRTQCPVLILLDIHMPVLDGFGFLEALQNSADLNCAASGSYCLAPPRMLWMWLRQKNTRSLIL